MTFEPKPFSNNRRGHGTTALPSYLQGNMAGGRQLDGDVIQANAIGFFPWRGSSGFQLCPMLFPV